ncbi:MAG: hypothetical protein QNJ73_09700 [Gammaproteobacteria bacterium]|nr:hypothetical protein [Gammaproteobacteria bacterium]
MKRLPAVAVLFAVTSTAVHAEPQVELTGDTFAAGQTITVQVTGLPGNPQDWVALSQAGQADNQYVAYKYSNSVTEGTWEFTASTPGDYEVRVYLNWPDGGYNPVLRRPIKVVSTAAAVEAGLVGKPQVQLSARTFTPREPIEVTVTGFPGNAKDWVAIAKAGSADNSYVDYDYTNGVTEGTWTYNVSQPGDYEVRVYLNWPDGGYNPVVRVPITVGAAGAAPTAAPAQTTTAPVAAAAPADAGVPFGDDDITTKLISVLAKTRAEAQAILQGMGYNFVDERNCFFQVSVGNLQRNIQLQTRPACSNPNAEVVRVTATETLPGRGVNVASEIDALNRSIGVAGTCAQGTSTGARCDWQRPAGQPTLKKFGLRLTAYPAGSAGKDRRQYWLDAWTSRDQKLQERAQAFDPFAAQTQTVSPVTLPPATIIKPRADPNAPFGYDNFASVLASFFTQTGAEFKPTLESMGYESDQAMGSCGYNHKSDGASRSIGIQSMWDCVRDPAARPRGINARETTSLEQAVDPRAEIERLEQELEASAECIRLDDRQASCKWQQVAKLPWLRQLDVGLEVRPARGDVRSYRFYPTKEIIQQQRQAQALAANQAPVTPAEIQQEADQVLAYCNRQDTYRIYNDCDCIRAEFIKLRQQDPKKGNDPIQVTTRIPASACPDGEMIRAFHYWQCGQSYQSKIKNGLEAFCACYADELRDRYLAQPASSFNYISRLGAGAMSACDKRGLPSTLNPDREYTGPPLPEPGTQLDARGFLPLPAGFCRSAMGTDPRNDRYTACQTAQFPEFMSDPRDEVNEDYHLCLWTRLLDVPDAGQVYRIKQGCEQEYGPGFRRVSN